MSIALSRVTSIIMIKAFVMVRWVSTLLKEYLSARLSEVRFPDKHCSVPAKGSGTVATVSGAVPGASECIDEPWRAL